MQFLRKGKGRNKIAISYLTQQQLVQRAFAVVVRSPRQRTDSQRRDRRIRPLRQCIGGSCRPLAAGQLPRRQLPATVLSR